MQTDLCFFIVESMHEYRCKDEQSRQHRIKDVARQTVSDTTRHVSAPSVVVPVVCQVAPLLIVLQASLRTQYL